MSEGQRFIPSLEGPMISEVGIPVEDIGLFGDLVYED